MVDAVVAESAAGTEPDDEPDVKNAAAVVSMSGYLSRRVGRGSTPFRPGYDPLAGLR